MTALRARIDELEAKTKPIRVYANVPAKPGPIHVLKRGDVRQPGEPIAAGGIAALRAAGSDFGLALDATDGDRRLQLAEWITHPDNPLFARVMVNRLWHYHFGAGLVRTPNDFGFSGGHPSHPELLDWLASEFAASGWSLKAMHRLIVHSRTYRQSAAMNSKAMQLDAQNRFLWRMSPRRLTGEELRDAMLQVSGLLKSDLGGRGYRDVREFKRGSSHFYDLADQDQPEQFRRTLYRFSPRGAKRSMLDTFDCPDPSAMTPKRAVTTTPLQSLALLNNQFVLLLASAGANRVALEEGDQLDAQIQRVIELSYNRPATAEDLELARAFVGEHGLTAYCRVVFNSNEFLYVR